MKAYFDIDTQLDFLTPGGALYGTGAERLITTNPAQPGETIAVYLTGLSSLVAASAIAVDVAGIRSPSISFAGLTSDPGLYQINFQVPATAPDGSDILAITGPDSYASGSLLPVARKAQRAAVATGEPISDETQLQ